jgi:hypothetical protein
MQRCAVNICWQIANLYWKFPIYYNWRLIESIKYFKGVDDHKNKKKMKNFTLKVFTPPTLSKENVIFSQKGNLK